MYKILMIEDDSDFIESIVDLFEDENDYNVEGYVESTEALLKMEKEHFDLVLLDYFLKNENGEKVLKKIRKQNENIFVCFLTAYSNKITSKDAFKLGVQGYIDKSGEYKDVINSIKSMVHSSKTAQQMIKRDPKRLFSVRLKELREKNSISQQELANMLKLSRTAISNYEIGKTEPTLTVLSQLATIFKTSTDYLMGRTN
jgi:DNA-binding NarL/FixJ family response regulator